MDLTMNLFDNDAFSNATMTAYVNMRIPYQPSLLTDMGIFQGQGVYSETVAFDEEAGALTLIGTSPRGSAPSQSANNKITTRFLKTVRLAREAVINADQVLALRAAGTVNMLQTLERLVYKRIEGPTGLKAMLGLTMEHLYLGAIDGQVIDADGSTVLYDCFNFYGVNRPATLTITLSGAATDSAPVLLAMTALKRQMVKALNGMAIPADAMPVLLCGDNFFDAIWGSAELVQARKLNATGNDQALGIIGNNKAYSAFIYGGVLFVNYRGTDDGSSVAVPTGEARAFMLNVPGLFPVYFAPADTWDFVGTEGLPSYLIQRRERQTESSRAFEVQANPLVMCLRPLHLRRLTTA